MSAEPVKDVPAVEPTVTEPSTAPVTEPAIEAKPLDIPVTETVPASSESATAPATELPKEEDISKSEARVTAEPVVEGTLGYKAPGLIKSLRFSKKYFWLGEEAIDDTALATYLRGEKSETAHANAAFASQTGKGLLLFAKRVEDRSSPAGILNLAEATDVAKEDPGNDFSFKLNGHKHTFQAFSKAERDGWLVSLEKMLQEAKPAAEGITSSESYKSKLSKYSKPAGVAAVGAKTTRRSEDKVHDGTTPAESTAAATSEPIKAEKTEKDTKSRSQSRKRQSIFGGFLNKAEEKKEVKKEEKAEKEEKKEEEFSKDVETPAVANAPITLPEEVKPAMETSTTAETGASATPLKSKRGSVFGNIFKPQKKDEKKEVKEEVGPAVPAKETEAVAPVAAEAPQLDPVDTTVPAETANPVEGETAAESSAPAAAKETPVTSSPKGGLFGFFKQKEAQQETKKEEKKEEKREEKAEKEEAKKEGDVPATATTPSAEPKDKRRSSFFGSLASKKEKKGEAISDAENTDGEKKPNNLKGLFRKASRSAKPTAGPVAGSNAPPATPAKDAEPTSETTPAVESAEPIASVTNLENEAAKPTEPATEAADKTVPTAPVVTASA